MDYDRTPSEADHQASDLAESDLADDLLKVDYSDQRSLNAQTPGDKFRIQMPLVLAGALLLQIAVAFLLFGDEGFASETRTSLLAAAGANVVGLLNYRRLRLFPGSRRFSYLLPAFLTGYAVVMLVLLWQRPPYSVTILVVGAVAGIGLTWLLNAIHRRPNVRPMLLVPGEKTRRLTRELSSLHHRFCRHPGELTEGGRQSIVADLHSAMDGEWERALAEAALAGSTIYHVKQVQESLTGRVRIDHMSENSFGTLQPAFLFFALKTTVDRVVAAILIVATLPLTLLAALAIRLDDGGPPIFRQTRIGFRGKPFTIYKLRTMRVSTPTDDAREEAITRVNDSRITRLGGFLRGTRIDELPQLWNVLRGELSLIGPRPEAEALSHWYYEQLDFYAYRHIVRPGITGWAQVNQGHVADPQSVRRKLEYDFYYIKNFSLWLDLLILLKTVGVVLTRRGAK